MSDQVYIPFMGDADVSNGTPPESLASWVDPYDRVPLLLALSLYSAPLPSLYPFTLVPQSSRIRAAAWVDIDNGTLVIGCRGTSVGSKGGQEDLGDDAIIAGGPYCDLSLVSLGSELAEEFGKDFYLIFAGHSLGGTAAFCKECND